MAEDRVLLLEAWVVHREARVSAVEISWVIAWEVGRIMGVVWGRRRVRA